MTEVPEKKKRQTSIDHMKVHWELVRRGFGDSIIPEPICNVKSWSSLKFSTNKDDITCVKCRKSLRL